MRLRLSNRWPLDRSRADGAAELSRYRQELRQRPSASWQPDRGRQAHSSLCALDIGHARSDATARACRRGRPSITSRHEPLFFGESIRQRKSARGPTDGPNAAASGAAPRSGPSGCEDRGSLIRPELPLQAVCGELDGSSAGR
jgi:hypothetical protein